MTQKVLIVYKTAVFVAFNLCCFTEMNTNFIIISKIAGVPCVLVVLQEK